MNKEEKRRQMLSLAGQWQQSGKSQVAFGQPNISTNCTGSNFLNPVQQTEYKSRLNLCIFAQKVIRFNVKTPQL